MSAGMTSKAGFFAGHPPGLAALFMTELWERFSYYGMRALLVLYMTAPAVGGGFGLATVDAARIYGNYTMAVYLLAIPGGFLADAYLGARRAVLIGGIMIACGHYAMAVHSALTFYLGLALIALGTGLFKPSISALVGGLYGAGDARRDAGFSIFYMGINIGAFIAPLVTGFLAQSSWFKAWLAARGFDPSLSWHWGFGAAGVGMTVAMLVYLARSGTLAVGPTPRVEDGAAQRAALVGAGTLALLAVGLASDAPGLEWLRALFLIAPVVVIAWFARQPGSDTQRIAAVFVFFIASMVFWAIFEQAGLSIALFADRLTTNSVMGLAFPSAWFQALNPLFVIALAPIIAAIWLRLGARQPSAPVKFALGLGFLALSFILMAPAAMLTAAGKVSPLWLVGLFLLQTIGELCLSPVGLSTMTKLAPPGQSGLMLGIWFLASAWGNKLAGVIGAEFAPDDPASLAWFFLRQALLVGLAMGLLIALVPWLKRLMGDVR